MKKVLLPILVLSLIGCNSLTPEEQLDEKEERLAKAMATCKDFGFKSNSDAIANCMMEQVPKTYTAREIEIEKTRDFIRRLGKAAGNLSIHDYDDSESDSFTEEDFNEKMRRICRRNGKTWHSGASECF